MISSLHREKIKETLGTNFRYTTKVSNILLKNKCLNEHTNQPYSAATIRNVFNGLHENSRIEMAILEWFKQAREKKNELNKTINEVF